jgi:hypothetical protein
VYPVHEAKPTKQSKIVNEAIINPFFFLTSLITSTAMKKMKKSPVVVASIKISLIINYLFCGLSGHDRQRQYLRSGGNLKLRPVPHTERNKDNKTLNHTSTPPGANILLAAGFFAQSTFFAHSY